MRVRGWTVAIVGLAVLAGCKRREAAPAGAASPAAQAAPAQTLPRQASGDADASSGCDRSRLRDAHDRGCAAGAGDRDVARSKGHQRDVGAGLRQR